MSLFHTFFDMKNKVPFLHVVTCRRVANLLKEVDLCLDIDLARPPARKAQLACSRSVGLSVCLSVYVHRTKAGGKSLTRFFPFPPAAIAAGKIELDLESYS